MKSPGSYKQSVIRLTELYFIYTLSGTSAANMFWKHCGKSRIVSTSFNYNYDCSFNYRVWPYFWIPVNALKDICCRIVVCGKGLTK